MPKDQWQRANRKSDAHRRDAQSLRRSCRAPRVKRLPSSRSIPVGSPVLIRKNGSAAEFSRYVTKSEIVFKKFIAATNAAILIEHAGWQIWVRKALLK